MVPLARPDGPHHRCARRFGAALAIALALVFGMAQSAVARPRIGLALSGGGARALAEIGVLRALEEEGIPIDCIAGNSMGALIGGLYAAGVSADSLRGLARRSDIFGEPSAYANLSVFQKQVVRPQAFGLHFDGWEYRLPQALVSDFNVNWTIVSHAAPANLAANGDFDRLPIPFRAVALDLKSGELEVFRSGDLARAIRSSISVPVTFPPIRMRNPERILVDAGPRENLPIELLAEMGADRVIAVNCTQSMHDQREINDVTDVALRLVRILSEPCDSLSTEGWDVWIEPRTPGVRMSEYDRAEEMIAAGYAAAKSQLPALRRMLEVEPTVADTQPGSTTATPDPDPPTSREYPEVGARMPGDGGSRRLRDLALPEIDSLEVAWIRLEGRRVAYSWVPREELGLAPGDRFDLENFGRGLRRLSATNLYDSVWPRLESVSPGKVGIVLELEERTPTFVSLGLLYDNSRLVNLNIELTRNNVLRLGETWYANLALGNYRDGGELGVRSGRLRGVPLVFDLVAKSNRTLYRREDGGELRRTLTGVQVSTGAFGTRQGLLLAGLRVLRDEAEAIGQESISALGLPQGWGATDRSLFATLLVDGTDQRMLPRRGLRARVDYELFFDHELELSHLSYDGNAALSLALGPLSMTTDAGIAGVSKLDLPFRFEHRVDLTRSTLGRLEEGSFGRFTADSGLSFGFEIASNLSLWCEGRAGLWSDSFDDLAFAQARRGLQGGLLQRTPIGPVIAGAAAEKDRGPFLFIQVGHDLVPER
ncbi:MAG: patatin-like phospholipase family protein [Candidatus Eisenbacteria bacterium]|nr:patatin-like phospholipase family protein [Candidatus Eisenbacteria bacterium]